jgi:hypothetical protein
MEVRIEGSCSAARASRTRAPGFAPGS